MSDVKIIGRAIPQQFDTYKLGIKTAAPADGELIYELDVDSAITGSESRPLSFDC